MSHKAKTAMKLGATVLAASVVLTGCNATSETAPQTSADDVTTAMSTPTTITMWSWVPGLDKQIALFEKAYPDITVNLENVGQGGDHYTKVRTALKAGTGAPDVMQLEYQYVSSFVQTDNLLDLSAYGANDVKDQFTPWVWAQVSNGDKVYAIPQDAGPLGNLYREDILTQAGITEAPVTWDDYAKAATTVKTATGSYMSNLAPNEPGAFIGLLWQAGAKPFGFDGDKTVSINVNNAASQKVAAYWQDLIDQDAVSVDPDFTDGWYQGLAKGTYAGWLTAAWGPLFLQGTAKDTSGLWRAAPLPQWDAANPSSGNWGGSSSAVLKTSEHPIVAAELAKWLNTDEEATSLFATEQFLFPVRTAILESSDFADQGAEFYGGQKVNKVFADISSTVDTDFQWLPFTDYAYSSFNDTIGKAISEKGDLAAGLDAWQESLMTYAAEQGFTVSQ